MGVLESFTTRASQAPAKSTPAAWQSQLVEQFGAAGEFTAPIVLAMAMAAAPLARRFGVTMLDSFAEPTLPPPSVSGPDESQRPSEPVRRAA
ncbi:hypothetical protein [Streptomyces sp. NPDC001480]|uniref:hypothetical protein n=1 Tax=Streptomyces sp. NPDC001480 TaxID=3364577 RepID=UPI00369A889D